MMMMLSAPRSLIWDRLFALAVGHGAQTASAAESPADIDRRLVAKASSGDRRAFDQLYRRHIDVAFRRMSRLIGPDPEREDLVQQVFIDAFSALSSFRSESSFSTWLYRILVHAAYDHLRRRKRRGLPVSADELLHVMALDLSPEAAAHQKREVVRVLALLERLKPPKRIAFVLRVVEGLSLDEIGAMVGAEAAAVGMRVRHAQRELTEMIARDERRQTGGVS